MRPCARLVPFLVAVVAPACIDSSLTLQVNADARRPAVTASPRVRPRLRGVDGPKVRRTMAVSSFQDVLWQPGDLPGASIPVDRDVFLEYQPPPRQPAAPAPPDTEVYLAPMRTVGGAITIGPPDNITNNPGYDNQPFFTPDGSAILFSSMRAPDDTQADIYRYDIAAKRTTQVTHTPESEYSPTMTPAGALSVVRVELDAAKTQRLWQFATDGRDPRVLLDDIKPVGYHAWADDHTVALYVLGADGAPATLALADTRTGEAFTVATDVGRSIAPVPGDRSPRHISFVQRQRAGDRTSLVIEELNPATGAIVPLTPAVDGAVEADIAWTPDGALLMAHADVLYAWRRGQSGWKEVVSRERLSLSNVTRLAVSPRGDAIALVASPGRGVDILPRWRPHVSPVPEPSLVLLVEDDRAGRLLYADWLADAGFRVEQAHNGLQALERAFDLLPDAILTDLNIPGIDGYELTKRLKSDSRTRHIPVVAITGYGPFAQDPSRADRAGCDAILPKPCDPDDLESILTALIREAKGRRSA